MIFDTLENSYLYRSLHPRIGPALDFLKTFDPLMADGRVELDGENIFALVQSYEPGAPLDKKFESHRRYLDLQFVARGEEVIYHAVRSRLSSCSHYNFERDFELYEDGEHALLPLIAGDFVLLFPHDAHKPGCFWRTSGSVKKVVVKILL
jgi:biofilm protein TabA